MDLFAVADTYTGRLLALPGHTAATGPGSTHSTRSTGHARLPQESLLASKIKVLLLDKSTTAVMSLNSTQSELLQHDVFLVSRIDNHDRDRMRHLKCVCFLKPTDDSVNHLLTELRDPKYASYELYFSNTVSKSQLERLAESDDLEVVTKVEELFQDYLTINSDLYSLELTGGIYGNNLDTWEGSAFTQSVNGLQSLLLALKTKPVIRYEANSKMAEKLSKELIYNITKTNSSLFDFKLKDTPPQLLILDRKNDPITPLLLPWTFQSMVHELIGIENSIVDLSESLTVIPEELRKITLSSKQDVFFKEAMYLNFGDLSDKIKEYVFQYKTKTNTNKKIESIDDMKKFIEEFPEFKKLSGNVSKHMTLASELDKRINLDRLWEVSELEQNMSVHDQHNTDYKELDKLLRNPADENGNKKPAIPEESKIRLVALYALRYENNVNNKIAEFKKLLKDQGVALYKIDVIDYLLRFGGVSKRLGKEQSIFEKATSNLKSGFNISHSTDNIFMQHVPRLESVLSELVHGKLSDKAFPVASPYLNNEYNNPALEKAQDMIVFIIGGVTYEEARIVANLNKINKGVRIVLGGTSIHNTKSFLSEIEKAGANWPKTTANGRLQARVQ
jgi:hypothetical protein